VSRLFDRTIPTGIDHGTVTVLHGRTQVEVTTFRGDVGYTDGRHPDEVVFLDSLAEDLARRDFTINAMAYDLQADRLIDPLGGRRDLARKVVRAVGRPLDRFREDGLRPLRAVRFACVLDFSIEPRTRKAVRDSIPVFRKVAAERVREELGKILASRHAARGVELLRDTGLLQEILPELLPTVGFAQNRFHRYDVYGHTLKSLERARGDACLKLAVLLHDIGKVEAAEGPPGERTFYNHERSSARMANGILRRLKYSNADRARVRSLIEHHMFHYQPGWTDGAVRRMIRRVGVELLEDMYEMRRSDAWGRGIGVRDALRNLRALRERVERVLAEDAALKVTDLAIGGKEVMELLGIDPGPKVGEILDALLERVLDDPSLNHPARLRSLVRKLAH
jgi:tRNA nucleotidyltransferase (CCA-adding enzyme)